MVPSSYFCRAQVHSINGGNFGDDQNPVSIHYTINAANNVYINQHARPGATFNNHFPHPEPTEANSPPRSPKPRPTSPPCSEEKYIESSHNQNFDNPHPGSENNDSHDNISNEEESTFRPCLSAKIGTRRPHSEQTYREFSIDDDLQTLSPEVQHYIRVLEQRRNDQTSSMRVLQDRPENKRIDDDKQQLSVQSMHQSRRNEDHSESDKDFDDEEYNV